LDRDRFQLYEFVREHVAGFDGSDWWKNGPADDADD
jgi:hypothetical protein